MKNILKIFAVLFLALNIMPVLAVDDSDASSQSKANRLLTSASTAATGIGTMELMQGLSEQKADKAADADMSAYISTMRCSYGNGKSVKAGMDEIELPGGNDANLMKYRSEYTALANDLKERKTALNMMPGIESEEILDKSQMGLYDDENVGITAGNYASRYRAQMLGSESDQTQLDEAAQTSKTRVIGGAVAAGAGVVGGIVGDELINQSLSSSTKTAQTCTESGGTWQGARCHCPDGYIQHTKTGPCFAEKPTGTAENPTSSQGNYPPSQSGTPAQQTKEYDEGSPDNANANTDKETGTQTTDPTAMNVKNEETDNTTQVVSIVPQIDDPKNNSVEKDGNDNKDGNDDSNVISQAPTVTGQELVPAEPVDNDFVWNGTNSNDSSAGSSTTQAQNASPATAVVTNTGETGKKANSDTLKQDINSNPSDNSNNQNDNENSQETQNQQSNLYEKNCEKNGGKINKQGTCICPDGSAANITGDCLNPNTFDNDTSNLDAPNNDKTISSQTKLTCGVVGKKECNSNYYVCASNSDCTSDKLPANATAGHCWKSGSRSVCTATACKDPYEPKSGYCQKRAIADRNTDSQKSNTQTAQRPNNTNQKKSNTTNTTNKHDMVYYYNQTSKKVKSAQGGSSGIWKVTYTDGSYMSGITKCEKAPDWHNHECYSCSCKADIFNIKSEPHTFMKNPWQEITGCFNTKEQCNNKCADQCAFNANQSILPKFITQSKLED